MSFQNQRDLRLPLYQQVRDELLEKIRNGTWVPDAPIPTESELSKNFEVAVGTVRKAVETLVNDGLLYRSQGRGTFVRRPDFNASLFRFFRQLTLDGRQIIPQGKVLSKQVKKAPVNVAEKLAMVADQQAICLERLRILEDRTVLTEEIWLPLSLFEPLSDLALSDFGNLLYPFYEDTCGQRIASATETLTIRSADQKTAEVLDIEPSSPVAVIERVAYGYDKTPLEYRTSQGSAETFCYQVDIV